MYEARQNKTSISRVITPLQHKNAKSYQNKDESYAMNFFTQPKTSLQPLVMQQTKEEAWDVFHRTHQNFPKQKFNKEYALSHYFNGLINLWNQRGQGGNQRRQGGNQRRQGGNQRGRGRNQQEQQEDQITRDDVMNHRNNKMLVDEWNTLNPQNLILYNTLTDWDTFHTRRTDDAQEKLAVTPLEHYIASLGHQNRHVDLETSNEVAMIGQDNFDRDSLKLAVEDFYNRQNDDNKKLPYTLTGRLRKNKTLWTPQENKAFLDDLGEREVIIATPYFLGFAYNLFEEIPNQAFIAENDFRNGYNSGPNYRPLPDDENDGIDGGTKQEIAYLKSKGYTLREDKLIPLAR